MLVQGLRLIREQSAHVFRGLCGAFLLLQSPWVFSTGVPLQTPLTVPVAYLEAQAAKLLELNSEGYGELLADTCNRLELRDLQLASAQAEVGTDEADAGVDQELLVDVAVRAHGGATLFGRCRGPGPIEGRVLMRLRPSANDEGNAVVFAATGAEFRAADGAESLLTRPSRLLADALLVPRLQNLRVDAENSLAQIDTLFERFIGPDPAGEPVLVRGGRLESVAMADAGLEVSLSFELAERKPASEQDNSAVAALTDIDETEWQRIEDELDGFLTVVVSYLGTRAQDRELQLDLMALLIDTRLRVIELLTADASASGGDPLRVLFLETWGALSELLERIPADAGDDADAFQLAAFLAAGDALELADELGPAYGIEVSRDGLRRLALLLMEGEAPVSFTPLPRVEDPVLQSLFGFRSAAGVDARNDESPRSNTGTPSGLPPRFSWLRYLSPVAIAHAQDPDPASLLREIFPQRDNLDLYLGVVSRLIEQTLDDSWEDLRLNQEQRELFEPLVRATAWKETCWRHYLPARGEEGESVRVIRSGVGAVGMMQIVGRVWRSLFDIERLESDVDYNLAAGIDILEHYFVDYAIRRGEDEQPGGMDNLVRATYAAYNGGPSKLNRYRREGVSARARAVDDQFYAQYKVMRTETWPRESRCYVR